MTKKLLVLVALTFVASAAVLLLAGPTEPVGAQAEIEKAACPNPGLYTGRSTSGDFQDALEAAVAKAEDCAGCCDMIVSYEFIEAEGERGGFLFRDNLDVTISASW